MNIQLLHGDCLQKLKDLPDNSVSSVVCDPPYGLSFMSKKWDYDVPSTEIWMECLRVLKPGGHLLAFAGSRTYHRMAVRIEDAGFEIRDQIMWLYASGFPKSHNIGKAIDKLLGNEREVVGHQKYHRNHNNTAMEEYARPNDEFKQNGFAVDKGQTEWEGWGTALKPAHEPIVVARKPLSENTVALNVLKWGTGGINIDGSRVGTTDNTARINKEGDNGWKNSSGGLNTNAIRLEEGLEQLGRWPANIILDEEAGKVLDEQSGISTGKIGMTQQSSPNNIYQGFKSKGDTKVNDGITDKGGASRFFYCAKASKKDRDEGLDGFEDKERNTLIGQRDGTSYRENGTPILPAINKNHHPTVKPTSLMEYLIKLVTPVGATVLDPFMGSGSTGKAAVRNGFDFIGIEREEEYLNIAKARIENEIHNK